MAFLPTTTVGRIILATIVISYICLLVLNLVSFGGIAWITYVDYNVQFGLWRVCYGVAGASRTCNQWSNSQNTINTATNTVIFYGKPGFIQAAEGLEIVSLIFYIFAGALIVLGIIDLERAPLEYMFGAAAALLFLCIIFLSASLGVMSVQGRSNHPGAYLDWAWSNGIAGLVMTIVCVIALLAFIFYVIPSENAELDYDKNLDGINQYQQQQQQQQLQTWNYFAPPTMMGDTSSPFFTYPSYNQYPPDYQVRPFYPPNQFQYSPDYQVRPFYPPNQFQNPYLAYNGINEQQMPSGLVALARQHLSSFAIPPSQQQF